MEEEIYYNKFKVEILYEEFPRIFRVSLIGDGINSPIKIYESPFKNCQTFTIGGANILGCYSENDFRDFFRITSKLMDRKQIVIDTKDDCTDDVLAKFEKIAKNIQSMPYKSTNNSNMTLSLIQLKDLK